MITLVQGSIFKSDAEAITNPVNCIGVSGAGLAKQFKERFPQIEKPYQDACKRRDCKLGGAYPMRLETETNPLWIVFFPTKFHWRDKSHLIDIKSGLVSLVDKMVKHKIGSIAIPALGCGLGGLEWPAVKSLIETEFQRAPQLDVRLHVPNQLTYC